SAPGAAGIRERGARMRMRTGLFCAIAGANTAPDADNAPTAAVVFRNVRRENAMEPSLRPPMRPVASSAGLLIYDISDACQRQATAICRGALRVGMCAQERVDLAAAERPVVIEIGDDLLHVRLRELDRAILVSDVV